MWTCHTAFPSTVLDLGSHPLIALYRDLLLLRLLHGLAHEYGNKYKHDNQPFHEVGIQYGSLPICLSSLIVTKKGSQTRGTT